MEGARIQPHQDAAGEYRWRRIAANGNTSSPNPAKGMSTNASVWRMAEKQFPDDKLDWALLPDPDALIDDGDDNDTNDG